MKYIKLGGLVLSVLAIGFLLGSGSIGDLVRAWISGTGAQADQAAVEENRQQLADRDVQAIGEKLGVPEARLNFATAIQCMQLTEDLRREPVSEVPIDRAELLAVEASAEILALDRADKNGSKTAQEQVLYALLNSVSHHEKFHAWMGGRLTDPVMITQNPDDWTEEKKQRHDDEHEKMLIQYRVLCKPLLGRAASSGGE